MASQVIMTRSPFQSTSSVWRTTFGRGKFRKGQKISIHVLRVEDDIGLGEFVWRYAHFNPRPPCGGRPSLCIFCVCRLKISIHVLRVEDDPPEGRIPRAGSGIFQSTSSVWRTTRQPSSWYVRRLISIHVLRVEDDPAAPPGRALMGYFNPRPPCGGRQVRHRGAARPCHFNPRPPCGGRPGRSMIYLQ